MPTRPALHAPRRLRPKEVRSRSRVSGAIGKLQLFVSSESHMCIEPYKDTAVRLFFLLAQRGLSCSAARRIASPAAHLAVPRSNRPRRMAACLFFAFLLSIESHTGKQPHHSARPLPSAGHSSTATAKKLAMASSGEDAGEDDGPHATVLSAVALRKLRMRPSCMQRPGARAFRQYFRTLAHPSLRLGGTAREGEGHLAVSRLDRARLALRQLGVVIDRRSLASKELLFLQHTRRAARCLRDDLWRWGIGEMKKTEKQRDWREVPCTPSLCAGRRGLGSRRVGAILRSRKWKKE